MDNNSWLCSICLEDSSNSTHQIKCCNQKFHSDCLNKSFITNGFRCPLCRTVHDSNLINKIVNYHNVNYFYSPVENKVYDIAGNDLSDHVNMI